ncbi:hypothetical protein ACFSOZ_11635 [Mesorhizobium newzealandense]|uniref:Uncharacterized protein n=1 Tax=Mesorhizobium newzealandense TaxID=1300302 RepID=A0ABW4U7M2_9HYPH
MKRMREKDIPAFVQEVAATGCNICALGRGHYFMGDADVPRSKRRGLYTKLADIDARYGSRDHLRDKIAAHLTSIGRYIDVPPPEAEAWLEELLPTSEREIDDVAPDVSKVTAYDVAHIATYAVLLMAEAEGADWRHVARVTLKLDPQSEPEMARRAWTSHLARAQWLITTGFWEAQSDSLQ